MALGLNWRQVVGGGRLVSHRTLHQHLTEFLFLRGVPKVVAPQPGLRLELKFAGQRVVQLFFFAINKRGQPQAGLRVGAPAVKMKIPTGVSAAFIRAIEAHDVEILIFHPDTSQEAALPRLLLGRNVEHQAAHFAQKFAAHVVEFIVLLIEAVGIDKDHLQEAIRQILHRERKEISDAGEELLALGIHVGEGNQVYAARKIGASQEILVPRRHKAELPIGSQVLYIGFDQRRELADFLVEMIFVYNDAIDHFFHGPGLIGRFGSRCGGDCSQTNPPERQDGG